MQIKKNVKLLREEFPKTDSKDVSSNIMYMNIRYFSWIMELLELKHHACGRDISPVQPIFQVFIIINYLITKQFSHSKINQWKLQGAFVC